MSDVVLYHVPPSGFSLLQDRASLGEWYRRMKARPSFRDTDIWEKPHPTKMARVLLGLMWRKLAIGALIAGAITAGLMWLT